MLISIIIPVYNVEQWLDRCVESVVNQTYKNIEIMLIDDGSTDKSSEMCDKWVEKDNRITVYHKENEGLGPTRNFGLKKASREYIAFIDSDDSVDEDYIKCLYNAALSSDADFVSSDYKEFDCITGKTNYHHRDMNAGIYETYEEKECFLNIMNPAVWGKFFRRNFLLDNEIFQSCIKHEDLAIHSICVLLSNKIMYVPKAMYNYTINRNGSIMAQGYCWKDIYKAIELFLSFKHNEFLNKYYKILKFYTGLIIFGYHQMETCNVEFSELYKKYFAKDINKDKSFIIFGAGKIGKEMFGHIPNDKITYVVDNNPDLWGTTLNGKEIISFERLKAIHNDYTIVLAISKRKLLFEVKKELEENNISNYVLFTDIVLREEDK